MTERERALELYTKFQVYYWHEIDGYLPDDEKTLKTCINVVNEIINSVTDNGCKVRPQEWYDTLEFTSDSAYVHDTIIKYYVKVITELKKI
jgi:hypothetical protein